MPLSWIPEGYSDGREVNIEEQDSLNIERTSAGKVCLMLAEELFMSFMLVLLSLIIDVDGFDKFSVLPGLARGEVIVSGRKSSGSKI